MATTKGDRSAIPTLEGASGEWKPLFGKHADDGFRVVWYDFECENTLDWSKQLRPDNLELCINFEGCGTVLARPDRTTVINPQTVLQYSGNTKSLQVDRHAAQRHRFLTVVMSKNWLTHTTLGSAKGLNPETRAFLDGRRRPGHSRGQVLSSQVKRLTEELLAPPVPTSCHGLWFPARIQEILAHTLTTTENELFCERHKRVANERIDQVKKILTEDLEHPPALAELGRRVGCSPYHLSRLFSEHTGTTISRYLRSLRLERAAELLREGRCNVTEAALTVGYSSLSHFSKAFAEMFGECPCVFGLKKSILRPTIPRRPPARRKSDSV